MKGEKNRMEGYPSIYFKDLWYHYRIMTFSIIYSLNAMYVQKCNSRVKLFTILLYFTLRLDEIEQFWQLLFNTRFLGSGKIKRISMNPHNINFVIGMQ